MNILDRLYNNNSEKIAIIYNNVNYTYRELYNMIRRNMCLLTNINIKKNQVVLLKTSSQFEFIVMFLSLMAQNCWIIPAAYDMSDSEIEELNNKIEFLQIECEQKYFKKTRYQYENDINKNANNGFYHLTSGTSGEQKLCIRTFDSLENEGISYIRTFKFNENDVFLSCSPLYHSYSLGAVILPALYVGATIVSMNGFFPRRVFDLIDSNNVSVLIMVPIMAKVLASVESQHYSFNSIRVPLVGAGKISPNLNDTFYSRFGKSLMSNYGSTETGGLISNVESYIIDSIGKAMSEVDIKILDEYNNILPENSIGEIIVKSKGMFNGYYNDNNHNCFYNGYFRMGDLGYIDENGYVFLIGRKKNIVKIGGKKIFPTEIENVLNSCQYIEDCAVLGHKRKDGTECIVAFVSSSLEIKIIRKFLFERIEKYKMPNQIIACKKIPRNSNGKINYSALKGFINE